MKSKNITGFIILDEINLLKALVEKLRVGLDTDSIFYYNSLIRGFILKMKGR